MSCVFVTDSHCHVRLDSSSQLETEDTNASPRMCRIHRAVVCGTHPDVDWEMIASLVTRPTLPPASTNHNHMDALPRNVYAQMESELLIPGFGIHPWFANTPCKANAATDKSSDSNNSNNNNNNNNNNSDVCVDGVMSELLERLESHLLRFPRAIVGEIGLDKLRGPSASTQLALFLAQIRLAARYQRPVSVHCVRRHGALFDVLRSLPPKDTPPAIVLHGFTGSLDMATQLCTGKGPLRVYFGIGLSTSLRVKEMAAQTLPFLLRAGRALLETDAHHTMRRNGTGGEWEMQWEREGESNMSQLLHAALETDGTDAQKFEETFDRAFDTVLGGK